MDQRTKQVVIGSMFAFGLVLTPAVAQHEGHEHGRVDPLPTATTSPPTSLPKCPVTDKPVDLAVSVGTDDGSVFFCCKDCIPKYKSDPAKYSAMVTAQRLALANRPKVQVTCPVSNDPVDSEVFVESDGQRVYFCCKGCINKYQKEPAKYAPALANGYTYQTTCPVMGEAIDPQVFTTTVGGLNIYFCCKGCEKKLFKDPQKYAPNLAAQGMSVHPKEMVHKADGHTTLKQDGHDHGAHDHGH